MFNLEKGKSSPISPYFFHFYNKNKCLKRGEMEDLEVAKKYLEYGVSPETVAHLDVLEIDLERESLSSVE